MIRKIGFFFFLEKKFRVGPEFSGSVGEPETQVFFYLALLTVLYSLINLLENVCSNTLHNKTTNSMEKII